ncbi:ABC transporter transmembrane domain-containing protein [Streptomyces sp. NPDC059009]|uniref:ABC transporter transmembrane domain-containing protein n=1 Tax=Streptomyces sp. NPDC059009 TaxID=3346694 RepID=UPI00367ECBEB
MSVLANDPPADPAPERRGPLRYLWWLTVRQRGRVAAGAAYGTLWMVGLTLPPYVLSRAVDDGLLPGDSTALAGWVAVLFAVGVLDAWLSIMRHRTMTRIRMDAYYRTVRVVVDHATRLGAALPRQVSAGEVATIGSGDVRVVSQTLTVTGPGVGAVLAYGVVAALLLSVSVLLAVVVLLGVPLLAVLVGPLLGRLQGVETAYRERQSSLAAVFSDLVGGVRVLNGLGGKEVFAARYRQRSGELVEEGYRVGAVLSRLQALALGLPALFLAAVTWLAARMAAQGSITVGELVAVYGYVAVLVVPVMSLIEGGYDLTHGVVAGRRIVAFLRLEPDFAAGSGPAGSATGGTLPSAPSAPSGSLFDPESGVEVVPGRLTALVGERPADAVAVVDRLGLFAPSAATWGGARLDGLPLDRVRDAILVADNEADVFAGTLRAALAGRREPDDVDDAELARAVAAALADDIVHGLPLGLDSPLHAQARNLSGGQRQRVRLARALLADPEVLLAVEPTSAVDAPTEAAIAQRIRTTRAGRPDRATLITTTSPLVLDLADTVYYLAADGRPADAGSHRDLLATEPGYRRLVARGEDDLDSHGTGHGPGPGAGAGAGAGSVGAGDSDEDGSPGAPLDDEHPYPQEIAR